MDMRTQDESSSSSSIVGHGLLSEVLKMHGLLEEYQHTLTVLEIEKADKQQEFNKLDGLLKGKGETEERYKDEIWNLELNKQELLQKIHDLSQSLSRSTIEQNRLAKQEAKLCQEIEHFKTVQHIWESNLMSAQEQHNEETLALKKTLYNLRAEKDQIAKQLQEVLAIQQEVAHQQNGLRHVDKPPFSSSKEEPTSTITATTTASNPLNNSARLNSKSLAARHEAEIAALSISLDQAHEIIKTMQTKIDEERQERTEIDNLMREAQETIEHFRQHHTPSTSLFSLPAQQPHSPISNSSLASHSPASISNRQQRSSLRSINRSSPSTKQLAVAGSSPYPQRGKSLGDELSQAGSVGKFIASSAMSSSSCHTNTGQTSNEPKQKPLDNKNTLPLHSRKTALEKSITLTCVELPSITNHDTLSSFMSSPSATSISESTSNKQAQSQRVASHHEYYGTLIREPTSYIYKSKRDKMAAAADEQRQQKSPPFKLNFGNHDFKVNTDFNRENNEGDSGSSADAMTRTMIGNWMWKHTRKVVGSGISENRHRRFFWIHPYTQTLYWSTQEPGANASRCSTKSVLVESFMVLPPHEKSRPPGIYIKAPSRDIQIQCLDFTAHYAWIKSLRYLSSDADYTQYVIPTIKKSITGKAMFDRKKLSSLRQKNHSFTKLLDATLSLPNSAIRCDNKTQAKSFGGGSREWQPLQALFNNSTLIDLSIDQGPFIDLNTPKASINRF
ncbi:monooxygenase [Mucor velutinosus]|uniref:Monooxygenase n=1 Tax=Mucor velutinosus TaxID=708070 RepID=A0AAN7D9G9_9FUNG|nr:monooxygenase [Mucor velutinosus]